MVDPVITDFFLLQSTIWLVQRIWPGILRNSINLIKNLSSKLKNRSWKTDKGEHNRPKPDQIYKCIVPICSWYLSCNNISKNRFWRVHQTTNLNKHELPSLDPWTLLWQSSKKESWKGDSLRLCRYMIQTDKKLMYIHIDICLYLMYQHPYQLRRDSFSECHKQLKTATNKYLTYIHPPDPQCYITNCFML